MPHGIVERVCEGRLGCRGGRLSSESAALRELGDQTPMLGLCSAPRLHLSVAAVALTLTACCLVRDINDPVGLAVPVFFANGHVGDVLQPWPSPAWPVKVSRCRAPSCSTSLCPRFSEGNAPAIRELSSPHAIHARL